MAIVRDLVEVGRLETASTLYPLGFGFQTLLSTLVLLTGVEVRTFFQWFYPFFGTLPLLGVFVVVRRVTAKPGLAGLATLILAAHPDFLFSLVRGNHEKVTYFLILLAILMLMRALRNSDWRGTMLLIFFLVGISSMNFFYATSFALVLLAAGAIVTLPFLRNPESQLRKSSLSIASVITGGFVYLLVFHVYRPAALALSVVQDFVGRIQLLFLNIQPTASPYAVIESQWISFEVWIITNLLSWIVLAVSTVLVLDLLVVKRLHILSSDRPETRFLVVLHIAFGLQFSTAALLDHVGFLIANLQLRVFSFLIFTSAAISSLALWRLFRIRRRFPTAIIIGTLVLLLIILGFVRLTNDPLISTKWMFYSPGEEAAVSWVETFSDYEVLWTGFDERLRSLGISIFGGTPQDTTWYQIDGDGRRSTLILDSDILDLHAQSRGRSGPDLGMTSRTYSNGQAEVYRPVSLTPFQ